MHDGDLREPNEDAIVSPATPEAGTIVRIALIVKEGGEVVTWVIAGLAVLLFAILIRRVIRSFRYRPTTDDERRANIWGRRGGGDM